MRRGVKWGTRVLKEGAGGVSGRESDGVNGTCTLGRGWSRTELDHDD